MILPRILAHVFRPAGRLVSRPVRSYPFAWPIIVPIFSILLLSGCGGLSVASKNAVVATPSTISFGSVAIGQTVTAKVTLQNQGLTTVQIEDLSVIGSYFSIIGKTSFPITLASGASIAFELQFTPTAPGSASEHLMITSSLSADPISIAQVTGTGTGGAAGNPKKVALNWDAPDSPKYAIVGYDIYRSANGACYQLLNSGIDQSTAYTDDTVQSGSVYEFYVESVDASGVRSAPSNSTTVTVP